MQPSRLALPKAPGPAAAILRFALTSGLGLGLDLLLFLLLVRLGLSPLVANLASATAAVSFVYFASVYRIFSYQGGFLLPLFMVYLIYQAIAVLAASWAVDRLVHLGLPPLPAKLAILPFTFSANYLVMAFITRRR